MRKIVIKTEEQLQKCIETKVNVEVWMNGIYDDYHRIVVFNAERVKVEDG